jgi:hypothetical protein
MLCGTGRSLACEDSLSLCSAELDAACMMVPLAEVSLGCRDS